MSDFTSEKYIMVSILNSYAGGLKVKFQAEEGGEIVTVAAETKNNLGLDVGSVVLVNLENFPNTELHGIGFPKRESLYFCRRVRCTRSGYLPRMGEML